jgi:uncharacterized small protein (DUF1192 family)
MIGRRSSRNRDGKDGQEAPDAGADAPLFNLEELHERRIHSWSPEPDDEAPAEPDRERGADGEAGAPDSERPPAPARAEQRAESRPAERPPPAAPSPAAEAPPAQRAAPAAPPRPDPAAGQAVADESSPPRRRGRPRGRPRRQVHFHVDPDEERLLMAAVERYGSQQKGLVAALESLQEADLLRDEIERLRTESERYRRLLDEAESLFKR